MDEDRSESIPIGKRTRNQWSLREKELRKKNKRARLAARNKHREMNSEKSNHTKPNDGGDEEEIKVVDEAEYLRRVSKSGGRDSCPNVDVGFEEKSDSSVQVIGEKWNPLGADFDHVDDDDENSDDVADSFRISLSQAGESEDVAGNLRKGSQPSSIHASSENDTSPDDDNSSDEDFRVNEADHMCFSSEYSSSDKSWEDNERKGKTNSEKGVDRKRRVRMRFGKFGDRERGVVLNNKFVEIQSERKNDPMPFGYRERIKVPKNKSAGIEFESKNDPMPEEFSGCKEYDKLYLHWFKCEYGAKLNQGESHKKHVDKSCKPKSRNEGIEFEGENDIMSENSDSSVRGSIVNSSKPYYPKNDWPGEIGSFVNGGGNIKRDAPGKGKNVVVDSTPKKDPMTKNCCKSCNCKKSGKSPFFWASSHYQSHEAGGGYRKRGRPRKYFGSSENGGGNIKRDTPGKGKNVVVESTPKKDPKTKKCCNCNKSPFIRTSSSPRYQSYENGGGCGKRGRPRKYFGSSENGGKKKTGRQPTKSKVENWR